MVFGRATLGLVFPLVVDAVVPTIILRGETAPFDVGVPQLLGALLVVGGLWLLLDSVFLRFAREGRGSLVPIDPPRFLVGGGPYQVVRNPMYVANLGIITGSALVWRSWRLLVWAGVVFAVFQCFIVLYEEPTLRRMFDGQYEAYRRRVGRWVPRLRRDSSIAG